jgi:hypothetical protein
MTGIGVGVPSGGTGVFEGTTVSSPSRVFDVGKDVGTGMTGLVGTGGLAKVGDFVLPDVQPTRSISMAITAKINSLSIRLLLLRRVSHQVVMSG